MPSSAHCPQFSQRAFWADTAPATTEHPALAGDITADVTIIGAGFTGLRAALRLAEAGSRVVVLDAGDVAYGASGRSGGQVNPMLPFNTPDRLQELLGPTYFNRLTETALNSADELFALIKTYGSGEAAQFRRITHPVAGSVLVAVNGTPATAWSLIDGGIVRFNAAPAAGAVVTAGFTFHVPVRFASDVLEVSGVTHNAAEMGGVELIEVKGDA